MKKYIGRYLGVKENTLYSCHTCGVRFTTVSPDSFIAVFSVDLLPSVGHQRCQFWCSLANGSAIQTVWCWTITLKDDGPSCHPNGV